jgi:tetrahydromethanopterin S-methyltransferase subunit B
MFRVHQPAKSYLIKQIQVLTWADFSSVLNPIINKAAYLHYTGPGAPPGGLPHPGYPPEESLTKDLSPDHTPWDHHPETGEKLEGGQHPIDYVLNDLVSRYGDKGVDMDGAKRIVDAAIVRYNNAHPDDSQHKLPDVDSPLWRKVFAGDLYDHTDPAHMRSVRGADPLFEGGPTPLQTYAFNNANIDHPLSMKGRWLDSGLFHMNRELGEVLNGIGLDTPENINSLKYVKYNRILPRSLTPNAASWDKNQLSHALRTGNIPNNLRNEAAREALASQQSHPEVFLHSLYPILPDAAFETSGPRGGRGKTSGPEAKAAKIAEFKEALESKGVDVSPYSDEDLYDMRNSPIMSGLFQEVTKLDSKAAGGYFKNIIHNTANAAGSHTDYADDELIHHINQQGIGKFDKPTSFHGRSNHAGKVIVGHLSHAAHQLMNQGMDKEQAMLEAVNQFRNAEITTPPKSKPKEGLREKTESVLQQMLDHTGHDPFELQDIQTDFSQTATTGLPAHFGEEQAHMAAIPEHFERRVLMPTEMAPTNQSREEGPALTPPVQPQPEAPPLSSFTRQPEAPAPLPPPSPPVAVAPGLRQRSASPVESRFIQQYPGMTQPVGEGRVSRQTMFDPFTGELITTSNDVLTGLDDILRKMDKVQALDAMQDDSVRKLLPSDKVSINSFWDVQRVAKSLGITSVDVHGLYQSTGDWHKVADQWNVKPDVVKAVKIAFGGV